MNKNAPAGFIPYQRGLKAQAQKNRKNATPAERKLWNQALRGRQLSGFKFTRQKPLGRYIVDFYCSALRLAIEVDGDTHGKQHAYDIARTQRLNRLGVEVVRYTNREVMNNIEGVYQDLLRRVDGKV